STSAPAPSSSAVSPDGKESIDMFMYKVAEPNDALIISGARAHHGPEGDAAGLGFKIVVGKGAFYIPGLNTVRRLSLDIHEAELDLECVTTQGIPIGVKA